VSIRGSSFLEADPRTPVRPTVHVHRRVRPDLFKFQATTNGREWTRIENGFIRVHSRFIFAGTVPWIAG
jgi:hypothetical protein